MYLFHLLLPCPLIRPCPALPAIISWAHRRRQQQPPQSAARKARGPGEAMGAGGRDWGSEDRTAAEARPFLTPLAEQARVRPGRRGRGQTGGVACRRGCVRRFRAGLNKRGGDLPGH